MRVTKDEPIPTDTYENVNNFIPEDNSLYIYGDGIETRAAHVSRLKSTAISLTFYRIEKETQSSFDIVETGVTYLLRSTSSLNALWSAISPETNVYIDMTGLTHPVWAALLRSSIEANRKISFVYVEPGEYVRSNAPVEGQIYDLSTRISGIAPLAGFAKLDARMFDNFIFVPLLGFEGTRLKFLIEQVQPGSDNIFPVIGSPGYKPWYVFETYLGNRVALAETSAWHSVRYAAANCPFSCYYLLQDIHNTNPETVLKIAPIGTKPHALGAVLFSLVSGCPTELIYDHPVRKPGRTYGTERLLVFHISSLVQNGIVTVPGQINRINRSRRRDA